MAKIVCEDCGTEFKFEVAKDFDTCPVCGASLTDDPGHESPTKKKTTYYYYDDGSATLTTTLYSHSTPLYEFEAVDMKDAERQLQEVCPDSPLLKSNPESVVRCPRCSSKEYTLLNKGYSLFTGFLGSGRVKRVCNYCKKEF